MAVRNEAVRLSLQDAGFTTGMAKAAAATGVLDRALDSLDGSGVRVQTSMPGVGREVDALGRVARKSGPDIDRFSGRLRLLLETGAVLGPTLAPLVAGTIPALSGALAGLGSAAGAVGVAALAFSGIGDGLDALNTYQLDPTTENLKALEAEMEKLGPAGAEFVAYLDSLTPTLTELQHIARAGLLPGAQEGLEGLMQRLPEVRELVADLSSTLGDLLADGGEALGGERWNNFFDYLNRVAGPTLSDLGRSLGNFAEGIANLMVGLDPASQDFSDGMLKMSRAFAEWSRGLDQNASFQEFLTYIRQAAPQAKAFAAALIEAVVGLAQAAAPVGDVVLPILTQVLEVFAAIAGSDIGAPIIAAVTAFSAYNRTLAISSAALGLIEARSTRAAGAIGKVGSAVGVAGAALASLGIVDGLQRQFDGLTTGLEGTTAQLLNLSEAGSGSKLTGEFNDIADAFDRLTDPNKAQAFQDSIYEDFGFLGSDSVVDKAKAQFEALDTALVNIIATAGTGEAQKAFNSLAKSMDLSGGEQKELLELLPQYKDAQVGAGNAARTSASSVDAASEAFQRQAAATREARQEARDVARQFIGIGASVDDAKVSLGDWLKELEQQARALRNFRINAETAADRGLRQGLIAALEEAGPAGALRMKQLADATDDEIRRANRAWGAGQREVRNYTNAVNAVPKKASTELRADAARARSQLAAARGDVDKYDRSSGTADVLVQNRDALWGIRAVEHQLNALNGDVATTYIKTIHIEERRDASRAGVGPGVIGTSPKKRAAGGPVYGPGGPTDDLIPALLSNREYVMPVAAVDHYGLDFMEDIRARRFAGGGLVAAGEADVSPGARYRGLPELLERVA